MQSRTAFNDNLLLCNCSALCLDSKFCKISNDLDKNFI